MKYSALILALVASVASAQSYYGPNGQYQGQAIQNGNTTNYYGPNGAYQGQSVQGSGQTNYYGSNGAYQGQYVAPVIPLPAPLVPAYTPPPVYRPIAPIAPIAPIMPFGVR